MTVIILGAGIAGLSAGYHLRIHGIPSVLIEKEGEPGGLCRSVQYENMFFDYGVHISFTNDKSIQDFFRKSVNNDYIKKEAIIKNYWHGFWLEHPPISNLHPLPKQIVKKILLDFIRRDTPSEKSVTTYKDWCVKYFGNYFYQKFSALYTKKFWTLDAQNLTTDWINERIDKTSLESIIDGILNITTQNNHYVTTFRYPKTGGYSSFLSWGKNLNIRYHSSPELIDPVKKIITLTSGVKIPYESLISSIPLPELITRIDHVPQSVKKAVKDLKWTSLLMLNFKVSKNAGPNQSHWNYYYDLELPFTRLVFMSNFPKEENYRGQYTIQAEIPYSKYRPLEMSIEDTVQLSIKGISKTESINEEDIEYLGKININYGYVIFDKKRSNSVKLIHDYLKSCNIFYCGRFGEWEYLWSDQAFISGKNAAENILKEKRGN